MLREVHKATMNAMIDLINLTTVRKEKGQMLFTEGKKTFVFACLVFLGVTAHVSLLKHVRKSKPLKLPL